MTTFKQALAADVTAVFFNTAEFANVGSFKGFESGTTTANVPFIANLGVTDQQQGYGVASTATVLIPVAAIPVPENNDTLTFGSTVYTIREQISADDGVYVLAVDTAQKHNPR